MRDDIYAPQIFPSYIKITSTHSLMVEDWRHIQIFSTGRMKYNTLRVLPLFFFFVVFIYLFIFFLKVSGHFGYMKISKLFSVNIGYSEGID